MRCTLREWRLSDAKDLANTLSNKNIKEARLPRVFTLSVDGLFVFIRLIVKIVVIVKIIGCRRYLVLGKGGFYAIL